MYGVRAIWQIQFYQPNILRALCLNIGTNKEQHELERSSVRWKSVKKVIMELVKENVANPFCVALLCDTLVF